MNDALAVLEELTGAGAPERDGPEAGALGLLALVGGAGREPAEGSDGTDGRWRIARKVAADRVIPAVDREARHTRKGKSKRRCPAGQVRQMSKSRTATFGAACAGCPLRSMCTTARDGRSMTIHPHEGLLRAARAQARTETFKHAYPTRSAIERIIAWTATQNGRRVKLRYIGTAQNDAWLHNRCAAINLRTLLRHGLTRSGGAWVLA